MALFAIRRTCLRFRRPRALCKLSCLVVIERLRHAHRCAPLAAGHGVTIRVRVGGACPFRATGARLDAHGLKVPRWSVRATFLAPHHPC